jgi:hypothetical protein
MSLDRPVSQRTISEREDANALIMEQAKLIVTLEQTVIGLSKLVAQAAMSGFISTSSTKPVVPTDKLRAADCAKELP